MFEELAQGDDLTHVDDAALVTAITGWTRAEATVAAHRMAAIAELTDRRGASEQAVERQFWSCDAWDSAAAEIAAASGISARVASNQMHQALALRYRLPQIAKLMTEGTLSPRLANTISWRTQLIDDPDVLAEVEADLADVAASFGSLSVSKLEGAIDAAITVHDPAAVRREQTAAKGCDLEFGNRDDTTGTISMWGRLSITDGELFERRVNQLARSVCRSDPRTLGVRRSAAIGVLGAGGTELPCTCGRPDCTAKGRDARADAIVIHVLTDHHLDTDPPADPGPDAAPPPDTEPPPDAEPPPNQGPYSEPPPDAEPPPNQGPDSEPSPDTEPDAGPAPDPDPHSDLDLGSDPGPFAGPSPDPERDCGPALDLSCGPTVSGGQPPAGPDRGTAAEPQPATQPDPPDAEPPDADPPGADPPDAEPSDSTDPEIRSTASGLAVIAGGGIVPTALLSELIDLGATVRPVPIADELCTEPRYRPSAKLARYVRSRDLTCCFPGCDRPAERCDLDHTTPHGVGGLTHTGNTKCLCRKHHLLKTFWTGPTGWTDQQLADGTIVWISPTGHRYTRPPGSRMYFPHWDTHTPLPAGTPTPPAADYTPDRGLRMPTRKKSRVDERAQRLHAERQRNQRAIDEDQPPY